MDAQQPLPTTQVTTNIALKAIVRVAKSLQKEANITAGFKSNLPAICDKSNCQICDPSVRRIRSRAQEGGGISCATIDFKEKIDKLGERYPEMWKMFFTRIKWEKWYGTSEERIDVRHFVMDKNALEWAMMFLGHGEFSERKTRRRGHDESESKLRNRSRWILKLRGAIVSILRNWEVISCQLGRTMRKREARRQAKEKRRVNMEAKRKLRDEVEKTVGWMHLNASMAEPRENEKSMAELRGFDNNMVELDWLKGFVMTGLGAQKVFEDDEAREVQEEGMGVAEEAEESGRKRTLSNNREDEEDAEMPTSKRMASRRELSLSDRQFFVEKSDESDDEILDASWNVEGRQY